MTHPSCRVHLVSLRSPGSANGRVTPPARGAVGPNSSTAPRRAAPDVGSGVRAGRCRTLFLAELDRTGG